MTEARSSVYSPTRPGKGRLAWLDFLTMPADKAHEQVRLEILDTLVLSRSNIMFGAFSVSILLLAVAWLHDVWAALIAGTAFVATAALRMRVISHLKGKTLDWSGVGHIVLSGILYAIAIGLVGTAAAFSGNAALQVLGAMVMTGMVFGFCISNSGAPRFAETQALIVTLPYLLGAAISGPPSMLLILLQAPFWIVGLHGLISTTHRRLAELVMAQLQNQFLAYNDTLTGLANRAQVMSSLTQIAKDREQRSPPPYVLYLDLDGFKAVNDTYGHAMGDTLLRAVAQRMAECVRAGDLVGRIGGDEFVIILRDLHPEDIRSLAHRLTEAISRPFILSAGIEAKVGVSIGGAPLGRNPEEAMAQADVMLYSAKRDGRSTYRLTGI
jgi:diguanylate cyclase (GGDEF) domain